ncbi:hypothetical protein CXP51_13900 [Ethanoligenens harbinense]|nr:hypothetical protein CXQ68_14000 [Ethanoligenens harbinense YUAN-3]AYF39883.1 hypothetical protein CXP51_13900 [Ethanoligenens harbinense]AYF42714.1 hypothetical protein CN246_14480 [Ethanoligenens harbinense]
MARGRGLSTCRRSAAICPVRPLVHLCSKNAALPEHLHRLRRTGLLHGTVREPRLSPRALIRPLFIVEASGIRWEIPSLPGQSTPAQTARRNGRSPQGRCADVLAVRLARTEKRYIAALCESALGASLAGADLYITCYAKETAQAIRKGDIG